MTAAFARKFHGPLSSDKGAFMATIHRFSLSLPVIVAMLTAAGCATTDVNHYKPALASQEQCCNRLADPNAKQACLAEIPAQQQLDCLNDLESTQQARNETPAAAK
jgi:hypothetical protein